MAAPVSSTSTSRRTKAADKSGYNVLGLIIALLAVSIAIGGKLGWDSATSFKNELLALQDRHDKAIAKEKEVELKLQKNRKDMKDVKDKADNWKIADKKIGLPWTVNVSDWLSRQIAFQKPPLTSEGSSSEESTVDKSGKVTMRVYGEFGSLLNWIMTAEHELNMIRVREANWKARTPKTVALTLNVEVEHHE
ncbi:MAG: hypothetical protein V1746_01340 [bacterium]